MADAMIAHSSYVMCDECGNPAGESVEGAKAARRLARAEGYVRLGGRDLCPDCRPSDDPANSGRNARVFRPTRG